MPSLPLATFAIRCIVAAWAISMSDRIGVAALGFSPNCGEDFAVIAGLSFEPHATRALGAGTVLSPSATCCSQGTMNARRAWAAATSSM